MENQNQEQDLIYTVLILCSLKNNYFSKNISKNKIKKKVIGRWSKYEHKLFVKYLSIYGRNWKKISRLIKTRNTIQIRSHAQKFFKKT